MPWASCCVIALAAAVLVIHLRQYRAFVADDAFISLRYSQRLLDGHGLTWNSGPRVEGYSNLLWVLLCAAAGRFTNLVTGMRLLGAACTWIAFAALVTHAWTTFCGRRRQLALFLSLVPFALASPVAVWANGGLEQPLLLAEIAWSMVLLLRYLRLRRENLLVGASILLGLAVLTRADGFIETAAFAAAIFLLASRKLLGWRALAILLAFPILCYLGQLAFRLEYYHDWLPNTVYVKVAFTRYRLVSGCAYILATSIPLAGLIALWVVGLMASKRTGRQNGTALVLLSLPLLLTAYVWFVGGDIFPAGRMLVPEIPALCLAAAYAADFVAERHAFLPQAALSFVLCVCALATACSLVLGRAAKQETWEAQYRVLALSLRQQFAGNPVLISSDAAGVIPFYTGFDAIDPLGLNDKHIARAPSAAKGHGWVGHEMGDGRYVLDHRPGIVIFGTPTEHPSFPSDDQIFTDPRFAEQYRLVRFRFSQPDSSDLYFAGALYARTEDVAVLRANRAVYFSDEPVPHLAGPR